MAEEKKDAFTFSDKIKNSKPAFNPFSKRVSSKVGSNGKPKKTLFERTRRDAPFFIAALAALLMLPFLYKYSGSVAEGVAIITPGVANAEFDPERFDYDPTTDESYSEVSQLTGRDPLSLIKGWGSSSEVSDEARYDADYDRDGFADYSGRNSSSNHTKTVKTTRRRAPKTTRAAFKRTATKVNPIRGASIKVHSGGGPGSRFGGANLRNAARKDSSAPVRNSTKPVSLQPLRAAGAPSRSYYGQGSLAQARRSNTALSKPNAEQALKDALFKPIENGRLGGLADGFMPGGAGGGKLEHNFSANPQTPWWWDMMKNRAQKEWEWRFGLFRDPLKKAIEAGLTNLLNCAFWGTDDGDMGNFFATSPTEGSPAGCKVFGHVYTSAEELKKAHPEVSIGAGEDLQKWCDLQAEKKDGDYKVSWEKGEAPSSGAGFFKTRLNCMGGLGAGFRGAGSGYIKADPCDTENSEKHMIGFKTSSRVANWGTYHVVFAKNKNGLCTITNKAVSVAGRKDNDGEQVARRHGKKQGHEDERVEDKNKHLSYNNNGYGDISNPYTEDDERNLCVVYVARGLTFDYWDYVYEMDALAKRKQIKLEDIETVKVRGYVTRYRLGNMFNHNWFTGLPIMKRMPMSVPEFFHDYVRQDRGVWSRKYYDYADCPFRETPPVTPDPIQPRNEEKPDTPKPPTPPTPPADPEVQYTRLANSLNEIPAVFTCRDVMPKGYTALAGFAASIAHKGPQERQIEYRANDKTQLLAEGCVAYFSAKCLPVQGVNGNTDDNLQLCSAEAKKFVDTVVAKYNEKAKKEEKPEILYNATCPTIANLVDAMHIAQSLGMHEMPKAATCQLGKMMGRIFKDETVKSKYKDADRNPYDNVFGAFATYIEKDSAYFPAPKAMDAPRDTGGPGLNPRFPPEMAKKDWMTTSPEYAWIYGNYVFYPAKGRAADMISPTFLKDVQGRISGDPYPLKELSLLRNGDFKQANSNQNIWGNRHAYWDKYSRIYAENGCDSVYGSALMSIAETERYLHNVCQVQNGTNMGFKKPRSEPNSYVPGGSKVKGDGSNQQDPNCVGGVCTPQ